MQRSSTMSAAIDRTAQRESELAVVDHHHLDVRPAGKFLEQQLLIKAEQGVQKTDSDHSLAPVFLFHGSLRQLHRIQTPDLEFGPAFPAVDDFRHHDAAPQRQSASQIGHGPLFPDCIHLDPPPQLMGAEIMERPAPLYVKNINNF